MNTRFIKILKILLQITALLFLLVGIFMIASDNRLMKGIQYIFTAALFVGSFLLMRKKENFEFNEKNNSILFLNLGFIFTIVGLAINFGIWGFGITLFLAGFFIARSKNK